MIWDFSLLILGVLGGLITIRFCFYQNQKLGKGGSQWPPYPPWFRRPCQVNMALSNFMHLYRICCLVMFTVHIEVNDHRAPLRLAPLCIVTVQASQNKASLVITDSKLLWISMRIFTFTGNASGRVQRVHKPADLLDITFCTPWFWSF